MATANRIRNQPFLGKTAIICGGSKGIGKATALKFVQRGGSVCVIARGEEALKQSVTELERHRVNGSTFVEAAACDTTDMERLKPHLTGFVDTHGVPDYLFNFVGFAKPDYLENLTLEDFEQAVQVNYFGQLVPLLILLPHFKRARKGHIANVASMLGYMGVLGYAAYAPTKYALVGLTEVLRHELKPYNIRFSILYPPDTDTPGFDLENQTKPEEWTVTSQSKLYTAEKVAEDFLKGIRRNKFHILPGQAALFWRLSRFAPKLVQAFADREYLQARRKLGKA